MYYKCVLSKIIVFCVIELHELKLFCMSGVKVVVFRNWFAFFLDVECRRCEHCNDLAMMFALV